MKNGDKIKLSVPGTSDRLGAFVEELGFDDMVRVHITSGYDWKNRLKQLKPISQFWYLAHKEHLEIINDK